MIKTEDMNILSIEMVALRIVTENPLPVEIRGGRKRMEAHVLPAGVEVEAIVAIVDGRLTAHEIVIVAIAAMETDSPDVLILGTVDIDVLLLPDDEIPLL